MPRRSPKSGVRGYAFLILMMMVTILLISLTAALPSIYAEGQREKEEELIFRGNEYARAILLFRRQFGRFPSSVKELQKRTNGWRFLRHAYTDPMTANGKWRFIHANAAGMLIDSKTTPMMGGPGRQTAPGSSNPASPQGSQSASGFQLSSGFQMNSQTPTGPGTSSSTAPSGSSATAGTGTGSSAGSTSSGQSGSSDTMVGGYLAGVASTSRKSSFRVYNNHTHYDEWEFLGIDQSANAILSPGGTGTQPGQSSSPTGPSPTTPTQNPGQGSGTSQPTPPQNPPE